MWERKRMREWDVIRQSGIERDKEWKREREKEQDSEKKRERESWRKTRNLECEEKLAHDVSHSLAFFALET